MPAAAESLRRAAVLVASLDRDLADALLGRLPAAAARAVRQAVVELGEVAEEEREDLLIYMGRMKVPLPAVDEGLEIDDHLGRRLLHPREDGDRPHRELTVDAAADAPFRFLHEARMDDLAARLSREQPQTIAVVLAHLPAARAADVLAGLSGNAQVEVMRRLATFEQADGHVVREIEETVRTWIDATAAAGPVAGLEAARTIFAAAGPAAQRSLLATLGQRDPNLAERLSGSRVTPRLDAPRLPAEPPAEPMSEPTASSARQRAPLSFGDLQSLSEARLAALWRSAEPQAALLALAGSDEPFVDRVLGALSASEAEAWCQQLDHLGAVSLAELDAAQERMVRLAERFDDEREEKQALRGRASA